ncbi:hypothetical protein [Nocardia beijingensis]|uniref:hypothetical protein n=1 Tax=Nocardia beijingensis TaxID=95162 RepID=UPI000A4100F4|nr:hypothetical protein [Nocardia beijingensis]
MDLARRRGNRDSLTGYHDQRRDDSYPQQFSNFPHRHIVPGNTEITGISPTEYRTIPMKASDWLLQAVLS